MAMAREPARLVRPHRPREDAQATTRVGAPAPGASPGVACLLARVQGPVTLEASPTNPRL